MLFPSQVCFVVEDVPRAASDCAEQFGWGPFESFTADVPEATYRGWTGRKVTDVALGMAGRVQVELIQVREGRDAIGAYQEEHGVGFQHLGIGCRDRDAAIRQLESLGADVHTVDEYGGVRIAFMDVPTGPAMFELLQATGGRDGEGRDLAKRSKDITKGAVLLDRATIATRDMKKALGFYASAFGWEDAQAERQTLRVENTTTAARRFIGRAGTLEIELVEPEGDEGPYGRHLRRTNHGLVHAGGLAARRVTGLPSARGEWVEAGEAFSLYDWAGGAGALQFRDAPATR